MVADTHVALCRLQNLGPLAVKGRRFRQRMQATEALRPAWLGC